MKIHDKHHADYWIQKDVEYVDVVLLNKPVPEYETEYIHVREVVPGSVTVTLTQVYEALKAEDYDLSGKASYRAFMKALGFDIGK